MQYSFSRFCLPNPQASNDRIVLSSMEHKVRNVTCFAILYDERGNLLECNSTRT